MPAISYRGTSRPGRRVSLAGGCPPGKGVGRGVTGRAKTPLATILPPSAELLAGALFSAAGCAPLGSPPAPLFFSRAHHRKTRNAPLATAAHQFPMAFLLSLLPPNQVDMRPHTPLL